MITHSFLHRQTIVALILVPFLWLAGAWVIQDTSFRQPIPSIYTSIPYTAEFFKLVTAGMWPAAVDGLWINLIQTISENKPSSDQKTEVAQFFELATDLDPLFYELYEEAGIYFSFESQDALVAEKFLFKGITAYQYQVKTLGSRFSSGFWTHPYSLYIYLAYIQGFVMQDWSKARATFLAAADVDGAPAYLHSMKSWLKEEGSEKKLAHRILTVLIQNTSNEKIKSEYFKKLHELEVINGKS